jgi:hypothetical protein
MTENMPAAGWYQDPTGLGDGRYWDGAVWTDSVSRNGLTINVPIDDSQARLPPTPGTEMVAPAPQTTTPTVSVTTENRSPVGAIVGAVLAVLVVVLIVVLLSNNDSSNDDPPPATDPPASQAPAAENPPATEAPAAADPPADPPADEG